MANMTQEKMIEELSSWSVMEVAGLVTALEEHWGVSAAPVAAAAGPAGPAEVVEEQTEFDIELTDAGPKKIATIKVIRELTSLGLADAKSLVEAAPKVFKEGCGKDEANEIKAKLEAAGAKVTIK